MKKLFPTFSFFLMFFFLHLNAQNKSEQHTIQLDTIYANNHKNVALFFPQPIRQGIVGSDNFVFTYNRGKGQYFGLLQAQPGEESNLLVIDSYGAVFSYILKYKKDLTKLNYFIDATGSIGNEKPLVHNKSQPNKSINSVVKRDVADFDKQKYEKFSKYLLSKKQRIGRILKKDQDVVLRVRNIVYHQDHLYFVLELENRSSIDYEINFLKFSMGTEKAGKRKSQQRLSWEPKYKYAMPDEVHRKESKSFVYIMPKYALADDQVLFLNLNEEQGGRNLEMKVRKRFVNHSN